MKSRQPVERTCAVVVRSLRDRTRGYRRKPQKAAPAWHALRLFAKGAGAARKFPVAAARSPAFRRLVLLVPMLRVGTPLSTLCVVELATQSRF
jgi:hypothetical protein